MATNSKKADLTVLEAELRKLRNKANLSQAVAESEKLIDVLVKAREEIASSTDAPSASITLTKLQNPISTAFESITDALRPADRGQKAYGKLLNQEFPHRPLPTSYDAMGEQAPLINRAIAMHLLREGQFNVARTFLQETHPNINLDSIVGDRDLEMTPEAEEDDKMAPLQSLTLQKKFSTMYQILECLRNQNLIPAIRWAAQHSHELEARGSNLEFELNRLQFIYLFQQGGTDPEATAMMTEEERHASGCEHALSWARERFVMFQGRHSKEIQQLVTSIIFAANLAQSPYRHMFDSSGVKSAFDEASASFTRDFCSLLGLSSESPLYVAATAGAVALPQLLKYTSYVKEKGTEWTTEAELAFETPLPRSMIYHPIFVCPVSKEQTTDANPPVMLPCGHVVAQESLQCLLKGTKAKCPYCPVEGYKSDAKVITIL